MRSFDRWRLYKIAHQASPQSTEPNSAESDLTLLRPPGSPIQKQRGATGGWSRFKPRASSLSRNSSPRRAPILPPLEARRTRPGNSGPSCGNAATYCKRPARTSSLWTGTSRARILQCIVAAVVNVDHRYCGAVCLLVANVAHQELGDLFEPHSGVGRDQRRPRKRRAYAWPAVFLSLGESVWTRSIGRRVMALPSP
jgi:hypothetical protein